MDACNFQAPNGKNSLLFAALEQNHNTEQATLVWNQVQSDEFKKAHGDWSAQPTLADLQPIRFNSTSAEYAYFSNFERIPITYDGDTYPSVEHAYQAAKTLDKSERLGIKLETSGAKVRKAGKAATLRKDWEQVKDGIMEELLRQKFSKPEFKKALQSTNTRPLLHDAPWDAYWGTGKSKGQNKMGQLLEKIRAESSIKIPLDVNGEPTYEWVKDKLKLTVPAEPVIAQKPENKINAASLVAVPKGTVLTDTIIAANLKKALEDAGNHPEKTYTFDITRSLKISNNNYLSMERLAAMVDNMEIPMNVEFSKQFAMMMMNTPRRYLNDKMFEDNTQFTQLPYDAEKLAQQIRESYVPVRDNEGNITGDFNSVKQAEVVDTILLMLRDEINDDAEAGVSRKLSTIASAIKNNGFIQERDNLRRVANGEVLDNYDYTVEKAKKQAEELDMIINSFDNKSGVNFWDLTMQRLKAYDIIVKRDKMDEGDNTVLTTDEGSGIESWADSHFEQNPRDTATGRIKMLFATIYESTIGTEKAPESVEMPFSDNETRKKIIHGQKRYAIRSAKHAEVLNFTTPGDARLFSVTEQKGGMKHKIKATILQVLTQDDIDGSPALFADLEKEEGVAAVAGDVIYTLQPWVPKENVLTHSENYLGYPKLANFEQLFATTLGKLADKEKSFQNYISILKTEGNKYNPNLRALAEALEAAPEHVQNEFVAVATLHSQEFSIMFMDVKKNKQTGEVTYVMRAGNANRASQLEVILDSWKQNQKMSPILTTNSSGFTTVDPVKAKELKTDLDALNLEYTDIKAAELLKKTLEYNGIIMPEEAVASFIKEAAKWTRGTKLEGGIKQQFAVTVDGKPQGVISAIILKLNGAETESDIENETEDSFYMIRNPLYTETTAMGVLTRVTATFSADLFSKTHKNAAKKTIYGYGLNSAVSYKFKRLMTDPAYMESFDDVDIAKNSFLLTRWKNNPKLKDQARLQYLDALKPLNKPKSPGVERSDMSDREQMLMALSYFQNQGNPDTAHYISLTHSDKSTTPLFLNMPRITLTTTLKSVVDKERMTSRDAIVIAPEVMTEFFNLFYSEYDRIKRAEQHDYNNPKYQEGAKHFLLMSEFNYADMKAAVENKEGKATQARMNVLWTKDGKLQPKDFPRFKDAVREIITERIHKMEQEAIEKWTKQGFLTPKGSVFNRKYVNRLLAGVGYRPTTQLVIDDNGKEVKEWIYVNSQNVHVPAEDIIKLVHTLTARDYMVNSFLMNTSMSQIFYGDPAQAWKNNVKDTMTDYGKRLAKDLAPGREGAFDKNEKFTTITIKDFMTNATYLKEIAAVADAYNNKKGAINASDAQEFTSVQEHLYVMFKYGRISKERYDDMMAIVNNPDANGYYEFKKQEHIDVIMQPMKPVYAHEREPENGAMLVDYIKSSSYPLYPPFTAHKGLDKVRIAMEKHGIARVNFESAKKLGAPTNPVQVFNIDGTINEQALSSSDWTGKDKHGNLVVSARQILSRDGFKIQQENPFDATKESITTVSQMGKLIDGGLVGIQTSFNYRGESVSANTISERKHAIRIQMFKNNQTKLFEELGIEMKGDFLVFKDKKKFFDAAEKRILSGSSGFTVNDLAYFKESNRHKGELILPLMFAPSSSKFETLLMSMVSEITDIDMPGKSYIQASPAGVQSMGKWEDMTDEQKKQVIYTEGYNGEELKIARFAEDGKTVLPAQVLVPFQFIVQGKLVNIEDYIKKLDDGRWVIDNNKIPKELLQLIGARIPNQGHNSMLPIEIVGFVPPNMGDLMIVPAAITKQMGSDFDVDKLYAYRRAYESNREGLFRPSATDSKEDLMNQYFDIHWAVLNNPDMLARILNPLDKTDLKTEAELIESLLGTAKKTPDFYNPIFQLEDYQSQKAAKQLVALSSLATTFNAIIQDKGIQFGYMALEGTVKGRRIVKTTTEVSPAGKPYQMDHIGMTIKLRDENNVPRKLESLSGYGTSTYNGEKRSKHDNHTTTQSEFLDYAKNRISDRVALNTYTYAASTALTQLQELDPFGWAPSLAFNTRLFSQPIIGHYITMLSNEQDSLNDQYTPNREEKVYNELLKTYMDRAIEAGEVMTNEADEVSLQELTDNLASNSSSPNSDQAKFLILFMQLHKIGTEMRKAQSTINHDTKGANASLLNLISQDVVRQRIETPLSSDVDKPALLNGSNLYYQDGAKTEQGFLYDAIHQAADRIVNEHFPYRNMMGVFDTLMKQTNRQDLSIDMQKNVFNAVKSFLFTHPELGLWENPQGSRASLLFRRDSNNNQSLADRVYIAKTTWGSKNYLLQRLDPKSDPDNFLPSPVSYLAGKGSSVDDIENTKAWVDLLRSEDPVQRQLGEDLIRYAYITGGIQDATSFIKFLPYSYLLGTDMGQSLSDMVKKLEHIVNTTGFITQFFQHYPSVAISLTTELKELGGKEFFPESFELEPYNPDDKEATQHLAHLRVKEHIEGLGLIERYPDFLVYRDLMKQRWILYKKQHGDNYLRIDTLGDNKVTDEYSYTQGDDKKSLIAPNRSLGTERTLDEVRSGAMIQDVQLNKDRFQLPATGGMTDMVKVLETISADATVPEHTRIVSEFLQTLELNTAAQQAGVLRGLAHQEPFTFAVTSDQKEFDTAAGVVDSSFGAIMDSNKNKLTLFAPSLRNNTQTADLLNHELIHYHTANMTILSESTEYLSEFYTAEEVKALKESWNKFTQLHPEIAKILTDVTTIREQARMRLKTEMERKGYHYDTIRKEVMAGKSNSIYAKLVYAMESNTEFLAHVMSDMEVMQFLNKHQLEGSLGNFLNRVVELFNSLIKALGEAMGIPVAKGSLLEAGIKRSINLLSYNSTGIDHPALLSDPNNISTQLKSGIIVNSVLTAVDRIAAKLEEQLVGLKHSLRNNLSKEEKADKLAKIDKISQDIQDLKATQEFQLIGEIGKRHLGWVRTILQQKDLTPSQIMTASRLLEIWSNLVTIVYSEDNTPGEADSTFAQLAADANKMAEELTSKEEELFIKEAHGIVYSKDFEAGELKDIPKDQALTRGVSQGAASKVIQFQSTYIETVARQRESSIYKLKLWVANWEKDMASIAGGKENLKGFYEKFFQTNADGTAFGLVQRFSQSWYDFRSNLREERKKKIEAINNTGGDPKAKKDAWKYYWAMLNTHAIYADTRWLFDHATGEMKTDDRAVAHMKELEAAIGKATADELVADAQKRYKEYLVRKESHNDHLNAQVAAGEITYAQANDELQHFQNMYSPNVFFDNFKNTSAEFKDINTDYYAKMAPRRISDYYDEKFEAIQADPKTRELYDKFNAKLKEFRAMLPIYIQQNMAANFLPIIKKELIKNMLNVPEYMKSLDEDMVKGLTASKYEQGNSYDKIPVKHVDSSEVPLESRSRDLGALIEQFGAMALHYKHFADAKDFIDMGHAILEHHHTLRTRGAAQYTNEQGRVVTVKEGLDNSLKALKYMEETVIYKKARELEANTGVKVFSVLNPVKQYKKSQELKKLKTEFQVLQEQLNDGDMLVTARMDEVKKEIEALESEGRTLYGSKLGDKLIRFNQLKTISYNPFSALSNVMFGMISAQIHANGKRDFTRAELGAAYKNMTGAWGKWLSFGTAESKTAHKMLAVMNRLNILGDYVDTRIGNEIKERKPGWKKLIDPYKLMHDGDYFMRSLTVNAMMMHDKVEVEEKGVKKTISLWEALNEEGEWDSKRFGENKAWSSEDVMEQTAWSKFTNKAVAVNIIIHGNQDSNTPKWMNKFILGRLIGQFRSSWLPEGWNARFQSERDNIQLGRKVKGRYITYKQIGWGGFWSVTMQQIASLVAKVDPYTGRRRTDGTLIDETDIENLRRNFAELAFIVGTVATIWALKSMDFDDDDEDSGVKGTYKMITNMLIRSQKDLLFYSNPMVFDNLTRDIIPVNRIFTDLYKAFKATGRLMTDDEYEYEAWLKAVFRAGIPIPQATLVPKVSYMMTKDLDDLQN